MSVRIVTDSTARLDPAFLARMEVRELPLYLRFEDEVFVENDMDMDRFYRKMAESPTIPSTSRPPYLAVYETFDKLLAAGHDVIGIFISGALTGPYQLSLTVWEELKSKYPFSRVQLIDSRTAVMALGYIVEQAAIAAQEGKPFEEVAALAEELVRNAHVIFAPATLENLRKGGRIGGAAALVGSMLAIKPLLGVEDGRVDVLKKCRGNKAAEEAMVQIVKADGERYGLRHVIVHYSHTIDRGERLKAMVKEQLGIPDAPLADISPVIAVHVGAGAAGFAYFTKNK